MHLESLNLQDHLHVGKGKRNSWEKLSSMTMSIPTPVLLGGVCVCVCVCVFMCECVV